MLLSSFSVIALVYFIARNFFLRDFAEKLFISIFTVATIYYGILGPWYWMNFHDSIFLGVNWRAQFPSSVLMFLVVYLIVLATFSVGKSVRTRKYFVNYPWNLKKLTPIFFVLSVVGLIACAYVYFVGGALVEKNSNLTEDSLLLIFFQLSDVLIGSLLFWVATKGFDKKWMIISLIFLFYTFMSGFRSKMLLFLGPLLIYIYFSIEKNRVFGRLILMFSSVLVVAVFSVFTIVRVKFSGMDFDLLTEMDSSMYLYGFFAETNILFGLSSSLQIFGRNIPFVGFDPIVESFTQFIPRVIYPEKDLYRHLKEAAWWIGESQEALDSGTAMPFFGEYYASFGWIGVIIFTIFYAIIVLYLIGVAGRYSVTKRQYVMSAGLIAIFFGYYYFSRGSIAQISKGFIFTLGPYFYLMRSQWRCASIDRKLSRRW